MAKSNVPFEDIVSWTFGNDDVEEEQIIFTDAAHPERQLSKGEARSYVKRLATGLRHQNGSQPLKGDVVCVHMFNDIFFPVLFLGIVGSGGTFTATNPAYTPSELKHHFGLSKTRWIITEPEHFPSVAEASADCNIPSSNIFVLDFFNKPVPTGSRSWMQLLSDDAEDWERSDCKDHAENRIAALCSTSGTTGMPKMAARSHSSLTVETQAIIEGEAPKPYKQNRLLFVPFFHAFASPLANFAAIRDGVSTYVMRRYDEHTFLTSVLKYDITETALVPPLVLRFMVLPLEERFMLKQLQTVWCGGAPLDKETQHKALDMFASNARISQVWGMTECGWISTFSYPERDETGSVGRPIRGSEARIVDDKGMELTDPDCRGEIVVKSPSIMQGYLGNMAATQESIDKSGWLKTGDVACIKQGKIYIVDRKKELIKVRGWQVAPAELEGILLTHPAIADVGVIGVQIAGQDSETPRAYVVLRTGKEVMEQQIKAFLLQNLAKYKVVDCEIRFRNHIPKSPSGKILRKILREEATQEKKLEQRHFAQPPARTSFSWTWSSETNGRDAALLALIVLSTAALGAREVAKFMRPTQASWLG